jgi:hypothetical protein
MLSAYELQDHWIDESEEETRKENSVTEGKGLTEGSKRAVWDILRVCSIIITFKQHWETLCPT